ncbi:MAG: hypothetical protein AAB913_03530 [Patescibacteria group bacterium]
MAKAVSIKVSKIEYGGDSIGNDILLEIEVAGEKFSSYQTIKPGSTFEYNQEAKQFRGVNDTLEAPVKIRVTEKDLLFSDVGEATRTIHIDSNILPQMFEFQVRVKEKNRLTFSTSTAIFTITLEAKEFNPIYPRPRFYKNPSKKDYNRFDTEIANAVGEWNDVFLNQKYSLDASLDPSLVKAMMYVESEIGYSRHRKGKHPGYPDIMQVGTPDDPAIHTLNNDGWISPRTGKVARENEWIDGKVQTLDYKGVASARNYQESLKWGVRWLYHKAQYIEEGGRKWYTWEKAVKRYGPQSKQEKTQETSVYQRKVLEIYKKGTLSSKNSKIKLWSTLFFLLGIGITYGYGNHKMILDSTQKKLISQSANILLVTNQESDPWISNFDLREKILNYHKQVDPEEDIEDIQVDALYDSSLFWDIVENEKDWWEYLEIGKIKNDKIRWLDINQAPHENSILSVAWLELEGFKEPILEVYAITHMGNGNIYLYKVENNKAKLFFTTFGASGYWALGDSNDNYKNYGYWNCGEMYAGDKLLSEYYDLNNDNISDLILTGTNIIICDRDIGSTKEGNVITKDVVVDKVPIKKNYYLDPNATCVPDQNYIYTCK